MDQSSNTFESQKSLAEIFQQKRAMVARAEPEKPKEKRAEKTKEELALIRK
jgi:hypothetical protein